MLATVNSKMKFIEVDNRTSNKNGNNYQMVILVDMENYDKFEFFKRDDLVINGISNGDLVDVILEISRRGFNTNVDLYRLNKSVK